MPNLIDEKENKHSDVGYTAFDALKSISDSVNENKSSDVTDYENLLEEVRNKITEHHYVDLAKAIDDANAANTLRTLIEKYVSVSSKLPSVNNISEVSERIYKDMAGFSILTDPLHDNTVEEININGNRRGAIEITRNNGTVFPDISFNSAEAAADTIKKMVLAGGLGTLNGTNPCIDSYLGDGTRISAMVSPIVREEDGVVASIRRQNKKTVSRNELISSDTATADILDFAVHCLINGVSVGIVGGMSSGKTTDLTFLLNEYIRQNNDFNNRIYIIEDTREIETITWDDVHDRPARTIYTCIKPEPNPVTMRDLVKKALRFDPLVIVPAECRDGAAFDVVDAGNTGQTIVTTLHAKSAKEAYARMLSLCEMAHTGLSEETLMHYIVTALPIMIFKERQKDGSRKYAEVFEATGHTGGQVEGRCLFKYKKDSFDVDANGIVCKVHGHFEKVNNISDALRETMIEKGGREEKEFLDRVFPTEQGCAT